MLKFSVGRRVLFLQTRYAAQYQIAFPNSMTASHFRFVLLRTVIISVHVAIYVHFFNLCIYKDKSRLTFAPSRLRCTSSKACADTYLWTVYGIHIWYVCGFAQKWMHQCIATVIGSIIRSRTYLESWKG